MSKAYAKVMTRCIILSAIAIMSGVYLTIPPYIPFAAALAPLLWYHIVYLRPKAADGIGQPAIDSVYYYGFLVTVGALGSTALGLWMHGIGDSLTTVALQFGLGLLATGYAVWARIDLTSASKLLDETDLEEIMNRYIERSRQLIDNADLTASAFAALEQTVLNQMTELNEAIATKAQEAMFGAVDEFKRSIGAMAEEAKLSLQEVRAIVNDVTFGAEREALREGVSAMVATVTSLSVSLEELKKNASASAGTVGELATGLLGVKEHAAAAADRLNAMGAKDGSVAKFIEQAELGKSSLASLISSADGANCSLKSLDENLAEKAAIVDQLAKSARAAARGLNALHTASEHSATLADNLEKSITQLKELTPTITAVQHSISTFDDRAAKINGAMAGIESDLRKAADALGDAAQDRVTTTAGAASEEYLVASDRSLTSPVFKFQK